MGREFFPVAVPLDDDLVAGVGQAVQGTVAQDWIVTEAEPFLHGPVAGDDEAGDSVPADDQLVEVCGLLGGEAVETQIVQNQQVRAEEGPEGNRAFSFSLSLKGETQGPRKPALHRVGSPADAEIDRPPELSGQEAMTMLHTALRVTVRSSGGTAAPLQTKRLPWSMRTSSDWLPTTS